MHSSGSTFRMFRLAGWTGLVALALVLASCGQPQNVKSDVAPAQGTLEIAVQGVAQAPVQVFSAGDPNKPVYSESVAGKADVSLSAGTYRIDGAPVAGSEDPTPASVEVKPGQTTRVLLAYQVVQDPTGTVSALSVTKVVDATGAALPGQAEVNANKDVMIYASQTEEPMCVTVTAKDDTGQPVANAPIVVNVSDGLSWLTSDRIAILRGCASQSSGVATDSLQPAAFRDNIFTGADGTATFTLYATTGISSTTTPTVKTATYDYPGSDIAKVVVAAENNDGTSVLHEFKAVFVNIAHLWASFEGQDAVPTGQRVGKSFPMITNIWNERDFAANDFSLDTLLYQKQPQQQLAISGLGFIRYVMVQEKNKNGDTADVAHFDPKYCDEVWVNQLGQDVCDTSKGSAVVVPNDGTHLEDMPIKVQVQATLRVFYTYGSHEYAFDLKNYDVSKNWIGSYLRITKSVDHHVLTWAGYPDDQKTLDAANAVPQNSVFTATFTLTATNEGTDNVYDVSIADLLPSELGIVESSIQPSGGTYDAVKHAITWNYQQNAGVAGFQQLGPGDSITVSFQVYVRQKPGYCVDPEDLASSTAYASHWAFQKDDQSRFTCYADPYEIVNGYALHDVTASWFSSAPSDQGGIQAVTDFNGWQNEDAVVIWAVRPEFSIVKSLANPMDAPFLVGADAQFDITVRNLDAHDPGQQRQGPLFSTYTTSYDPLMAKYPGEFNGSPRDNPYGNNIHLGDIFSTQLDFNDATPLLLHDDDGVNPDQSFASSFPNAIGWHPDKGIGWATIPLMGGGDMASTRVTLDHDGAGFNINIAGMTADNLNQFSLGDCLNFDSAIGAPTLASSISVNNNLIVDCAFTRSDQPTTPWLELDSVGTGVVIPGGPSLTYHSSVMRGDAYTYVFSLLNSGDASAKMATNVITIDNTTAATITGGTVYFYDGSSYAGSLGGTVNNSGQITFGPYDHPAGYTAYFEVDVMANQVANVTATSTVDYDAGSTDSQYGLLPLTMNEIVSIQPPF